MIKEVLTGALIAWLASAVLGLLFAAGSSGHFSLRSLSLPEVIPVALIVSTVAALVATPFVVWALHRSGRNFYKYGPVLLSLMIIYDVVVIPRAGPLAPYVLLAMGIAGLLVIGMIRATS